jgi:hypothetical protein
MSTRFHCAFLLAWFLWVPARARAQVAAPRPAAPPAQPVVSETPVQRFFRNGAYLALVIGPGVAEASAPWEPDIGLRFGVETRLQLGRFALRLQLTASGVSEYSDVEPRQIRIVAGLGVGYAIPLGDRLVTAPMLTYSYAMPLGEFTSANALHVLGAEIDLLAIYRNGVVFGGFLAPGAALELGPFPAAQPVRWIVTGGLRIGFRL